MNIQVQQDYQYLGNKHWAWSVWLEGTDAELDKIDFVNYILHPTFSNPVRTVKERTSNFRLESRGWGQFMIYLEIVTKDGASHKIQHYLTLALPESEKPKDVARKPKLFLSASVADYEFLDQIQQELEKEGINVTRSDEIVSELPQDVVINSELENTDLAALIISNNLNLQVTKIAKKINYHNLASISVLLNSKAEAPPILSNPSIQLSKASTNSEVLRVSDYNDLKSVAHKMAQLAENSVKNKLTF
ncbi:MAG: pYEATS domain-containing protein [Cyanobacteria bacterium P01_F01_bin.143]